MNNELVEALRLVIKEELKPINERLDGLGNSIKGRLATIEKDVKEIKESQEQLQKNRIDTLKFF